MIIVFFIVIQVAGEASELLFIDFISLTPYMNLTAALAQWVRELAPRAEVWMFEFQPRQTYVVKTVSDNSTDKGSALGVSVRGPRR